MKSTAETERRQRLYASQHRINVMVEWIDAQSLAGVEILAPFTDPASQAGLGLAIQRPSPGGCLPC